MRFTSLAGWLGWLEQSHPKEIDLGLERIRQVAGRLDLLQSSAKVITVAGTNGKGSCVTVCAALLQAAGFSVGVYTSPHLIHYNERIQVNGKPATDELICSAFEKIADAATNTSLTYFEYGTLAALEIFKQQQVDFIVLEVGLGGRLDAVNILDADIAVITTIALDHQEWLGDNRELIGREKAGILRAQKVFVCADENPPESIIEIAERLQTKSYFINKDFGYQIDQEKWQWHGKTSQDSGISLPSGRAPHLPLPSVAAALQSIYLLGISLQPAVIETTLITTSLPGRFQKIVYQQREFILDVAHNPAATDYLSRRLLAEPCAGKTFAIVAMMADKDCQGSLANLVGIVDGWYLLDLQHIPRAATTDVLTNCLATLNVSVADTIKRAGAMESLVDAIIDTSETVDRIIVLGSFYTVAAALTYLQTHTHYIARGIQ